MNQILSEIRKEYDVIAAKNRDEAEMWYKVIFFLDRDYLTFNQSRHWGQTSLPIFKKALQNYFTSIPSD